MNPSALTRNKDGDSVSGLEGAGELLLIDKPIDWTSFDVVKKVKRLFRVRKVGHSGTLDPKATGLLIICTGRKTKEIPEFIELEKEYSGTFEIGKRTPSFDSETDVSETRDTSCICENDILKAAKSLSGKQLQIPPMYSAVKYGGKPLYKYARNGVTVERAEREVDIKKFEIKRIYGTMVDFCVVCSKGTYIRSLIEDLGIRLGCGATLVSLRRIRIGSFHIDRAVTIDELIKLRNSNS
jgi:tRNA pseudouridine55 synthase